MRRPYLNGGNFYRPPWRHPQTGELFPAASLGTADKAEADAAFATWKAQKLGRHVSRPAEQVPIDFDRSVRLSTALDAYLAHKKSGIAEATYQSYVQQRKFILRDPPAGLGDWTLSVLQPTQGGSQILGDWARRTIAAHGDRTHTLKKWIEGLLRPALKYAVAEGWVRQLPAIPDVRSDYRASGRRKVYLSPDEYAALWQELPEIETIESKGRVVTVYPRLWATLAVSTGLHDSDLNQFTGRHWRRLARQWLRHNSKGAEIYEDEYFDCDEIMQSELLRAYKERQWDDGDLVVASQKPPVQWMRPRLETAAKRAGLTFTPAPIDFRRTFATWCREDGWEFDEVAKVLGNSTGMVREVYAQLPSRRMKAAVEKRRESLAELRKKLTRKASLKSV